MLVLTVGGFLDKRRLERLAESRAPIAPDEFLQTLTSAGVSKVTGEFLLEQIQAFYRVPLAPDPEDRWESTLRIAPDELEYIAEHYFQHFSIAPPPPGEQVAMPVDPSMLAFALWLDLQRASRGVAPPAASPVPFTVHGRARSFVFACQGWRRFIATQHNAWLHAAATVAVLAASIALGISAADWRWIVLAIALVWVAEAFNTAIEQLGDAVTVERDPRIGFAKDIAAGAVLVTAIAAAAIGALTLAPYLLAQR